MPQLYRIGEFRIYFWMNEGEPLEPIHVHVSKGTPSGNSTKIWITGPEIAFCKTIIPKFLCIS